MKYELLVGGPAGIGLDRSTRDLQVCGGYAETIEKIFDELDLIE